MAVVALQPKRPRSADTFGGLSLVMPAWNESEAIVQAVEEACAALAEQSGDFELIVVDDGSADETAALVELAAAVDPRVRLIRHGHNRGYGAALRTGFRAARYDRVAFTDADCQFDLRDLARLLAQPDEYDIVCGYRVGRRDSPRRRFLSWGYNRLVGLLLGIPIRDVDCALKVYRRQLLLEILPESDGFFANTEMLVRARRLGLAIVEVGVPHRPRCGGESKVSLGDVPRTLATLLPFVWRQWTAGRASAAKASPQATQSGPVSACVAAENR